MELGKKVYFVKPLKEDLGVYKFEEYITNAYDFEVLDCKFVNYNMYMDAYNVIMHDSSLAVVPSEYVFTSRKQAEEKSQELKRGIIKKLVETNMKIDDINCKLKNISELLK